MAECQYLDMYCSVTNACTRVVYFLYTYHACDVFTALYHAWSILQPPVTHYLERDVIGTVRFLWTLQPPVTHYLERDVIGIVRFLSSVG